MTTISINRIGEPVPSQSIKVQAQPEAASLQTVFQQRHAAPARPYSPAGNRQIKKTNSQKTKRKRA